LLEHEHPAKNHQLISVGSSCRPGYAARHHLADHAGAVRFEHAWACIEVPRAVPFGSGPRFLPAGPGWADLWPLFLLMFDANRERVQELSTTSEINIYNYMYLYYK
jgi:hypothetical protein